jgi:hypothetical protein
MLLDLGEVSLGNWEGGGGAYWTTWKSVNEPLSAEYMHIGATQMRFWKVTSRILIGVKRVGGCGERAVPAVGD